MGTKQTCLKNMKDSGVYYIGSVPDGYEITRYKYLSDVKMGNTILESETSTDMDNEYKIAVYSATQSDKIFGYVKEAQDILKKGDIVIPARGNSIGYAKLVTKDNSTSTQTTIMSYNIRNVNNKYLFYCSWAFKDEWYRYDGSAIPQITVRQVENNMLPLPNALLQDKIVSELDKKVNIIDELIKNQEQQIEKLKEYKQSLITEVVTKGLDKNDKMKDSGIEWIGKIPKDWQLIPIKAKFKSGKGLPIIKADLVEDGIKVISYGQIHAKENTSVEINNSLYRYVDNKWLQSNIDCIVKKGDFIFADTSEDVAGSEDFIYINNNDLTFAGYHCLTLKPIDDNCNNKYLAYLFLSTMWKSQLQSKVCGVKLYSISKKFLMSTSIILPPINEQKEIVKVLDGKCKTIEEVITIKKEKIEKLNEYKKALIYEYVTGKKEV